MVSRLRVAWTLAPASPPRIRRHCTRCNGSRPFASSGKFRLNAHRKLIDVWLIYRCAVCQRVWNRPILDRCPISAIDRSHYEAMMANAGWLAERTAFDLGALKGARVEIEANPPAGHVIKTADPPGPGDPAGLIITIVAGSERPPQHRLDRLISSELGLTRRRLRDLSERGLVTVSPGGRAALKRPPRDRQVVTIDLIPPHMDPETWSAILRRAGPETP